LREVLLEQAKPDYTFYAALFRACSTRWNLGGTDWPSRGARLELENVVNEMQSFGVSIPHKVARKLGMDVGEKPPKRDVKGREKDPAVSLAGMMLEDQSFGSRAEHHRRITQSDQL
jgi:hypothetical protein